MKQTSSMLLDPIEKQGPTLLGPADKQGSPLLSPNGRRALSQWILVKAGLIKQVLMEPGATAAGFQCKVGPTIIGSGGRAKPNELWSVVNPDAHYCWVLLGSQLIIIGSSNRAIPKKLGSDCRSSCPLLQGLSRAESNFIESCLQVGPPLLSSQTHYHWVCATDPYPINLGLDIRTQQLITHMGPPLLGSRAQHHWVMLVRRTQQRWVL